MKIKEFKYLVEKKEPSYQKWKPDLIFTLWVWYDNDRQGHIRFVYVHYSEERLFDLEDTKQNEKFKELFDKYLKDTWMSIMDWKKLILDFVSNSSDYIMEQEIKYNDLNNFNYRCLSKFVIPM